MYSEVLVNGIFHSRIPASDENHHELQAIRFESKGDHRIDIKSSGGGLSGKSNPFVVQYSEQKIYWGDLHVHTNLGEGNADPEYLADLDFIVPAVHTRYLTGDNWTGISRPKAWLWGDSLKTGGYHLAITDAEPVPVNYQRELMRQLKVEDNLLVALADIPADDRYLDNQLTRLVEIVAGDSHFEWYANRLMAQGYRLGFTASSHSHLLPLSDTRQNALTAVIVNEGESYLDALKQGRTYITTGERIYLDVNVNGADPGSRIEMADRRTISGKVKGTGAIDKIELIKNGQVIDSVDVAGDRDSHTLKVSFYSASEPAKSQRDLPRNGREWIGYLRAGDSPIVDISAPGFRNASRQAIALNPNEENRLDFITWTRGNRSSFLVDVNTEDEDLVFELNLSGGHEDIDIVPLTRPASPIPLSRQMVSLFSLKEETIVRTVSVNGYSDKVSFELVDRKADDEIEFEFRDRSPPRQGDYYYVRVLQLDDQMAWSSPVFVGGYDHP